VTNIYEEELTHEQPGGHMAVHAATPAGKLGIFGWSIFDWALNPYFILVNIFVFAPYFSAEVIGDKVQGQASWGYIQAIAGASIALLSPFFGSLADAAGPRKPGILIFSLLACTGMASLWYVMPGMEYPILQTAIGVVIAATCLEFAIVYHNAMLPAIVSPKRMGFVSGLGIATGYLGAIFAFLVWLLLFGLPEVPALGLDKAAQEHNRLVGPLSALWFVVFALPFFLFTPDQPRTGLSRMDAAKKGIAMVIGTLGKLPYYKNIATYLVARMVYYDGQSAVFIFTGVYAAGIFDWPTTQIGIYGLLIIMAQVPSSLLGGWLDDKFGSKATIIGAVSLFALGLLMLVGTTETAAAFFIPVSMEPLEPLSFIGSALNAAGFETSAERAFLALGVLTGLFAGPSISSSRTMLARIAPPSMMAEFFGLYALCGKATSFMAPLTVAIVTSAMNSQRIGLASVLIFMVVGLGLMIFVREEQSTAHTEH
jgi:UMF1 family MFS transporter